ncbi:hypothetical protein [Streptomyces sp. NPDC013489]|uniref:hypothetical protein n=1 Tax=Streptomyces sp. NPDC013489 TaxID=3155606 RepID=UPI0033D234CF
MTIQHIPDAQQDRRALLLLVNDDQRLLLCGTCCGERTLPSIHVGTDGEPQRLAREHLAQTFGIHTPRLTAVRGVHTTAAGQTWQHERVTETHALIWRITDQEARSACGRAGRHSLWSLDDLRLHRRQVTPQGVITLLAGFLEGWLPDGSHSLH